MSVSAIGIPAAASVPAPYTGFFQRAMPVRLILASFFLVTLPMAALIASGSSASAAIVAIYLCLFGTTHFVLTFSIYLRAENLRHFASSQRNRMMFFGVPIVIFVAFYVIGVSRMAAMFPLFGLLFHGIIRLADFNHLNRQSFGVVQLFKVRIGMKGSTGQKRLENIYFAGLTGLLFCTYLAGGRLPILTAAADVEPIAPLTILRPAAWVLMALTSVTGATVLAGFLQAWTKSGKPAGLGEALGYLGFQTVSAILAVVSLPLYAAALAMHYVEYHVLMFPRCFHSGLDSESPLDRWFARFRANQGTFYLALIAISALVFTFRTASASLMGFDAGQHATRYLAFAAIFDGLFVFHYFIEMLIWRFGDPFFRRTLGSLYFAPRG